MEILSFRWWLVLSCFLCCDVLGFNLTIIHTNDLHARYNETNKYGGQCTSDKCYGGAARLKTMIDEIRREYPNTLLLDAGDQYQGTLWFNHYGGWITYTMMNMLGYDAMALGNHEFDRRIEGLVPLLQNSNFTTLSCNIDSSMEPTFTPYVQKHYVISVGGERIGIIGYTTKYTPLISSPGSLKFLDEIESIKTEVAILQGIGVNKIIALGHAGFTLDQMIAKEVEGIDIVVGGHTNTFLYTGTPPSNDDPVGQYPVVVTQANNERVLVVQDFAFGKYLGFLQVHFDSNGRITSFHGNPILLNDTVQKDPEIQSVIDTLGLQVLNYTSSVIGRTLVYLDGNRSVCRMMECNMGNLVADSLVYHNLRDADSINGTSVYIALVNAGSIKSTFERGQITLGNAIEAQPFRNTLQTIRLRGRHLREALEHSVTEFNPRDPSGRFFQVSGLRVKYDVTKPEGERVVDVQVLCADCKVPKYVALDDSKLYGIILSDFILAGGDGYKLKENAIQDHIIGSLDSDVFAEYIEFISPIYTGLDGRIQFVDTDEYHDCKNGINAGEIISISYFLILSTFLLVKYIY